MQNIKQKPYFIKRGTTRNHLKPAIIYYFLFKISYSQVAFVLILHPKVFLGKIWSQKLKFSKLTESWYKCTLLHPYFKFNVYFFIFFWQIWSQNLQFSKLAEIWYRGALLYVYYDFNVYFFKIVFIHIFLGKFGPKSWSSTN